MESSTDQEQKLLKKYPYVKAISKKGITYTDEFKAIAIVIYGKGKCSCEIFEDAGFDINLVRILRSYMTYYNHYRGQWNLKKMTPAQ